jgi:replicative DNA helicase
MTLHDLSATPAAVAPVAAEPVLPRRSSASGPRNVDQLLGELRDEAANAATRSVTFATGFDPLDAVLEGGFRQHDLVLVGGAPGVGKTVATLQWARNIARSGSTAIYACYEHDERTLLGRLLLLEAGDLLDQGAIGPNARRLAGEVALGRCALADGLAQEPLLRVAYEHIEDYARRLWLVKVSGSRTDVEQLAALVAQHGDGTTVLFVDYLQKVPVRPEPEHDAEKVLRVVEGLKDLALAFDVAVVSVAAADHGGLGNRRLRLQHLRGSSALAYESDIVLLLNDKVNAVSKVHLAYDPVKASTFKNRVVFSLEKHRAGQAHLDLEFRKDFSHYRFDPLGAFVAERLSDERSDLE